MELQLNTTVLPLDPKKLLLDTKVLPLDTTECVTFMVHFFTNSTPLILWHSSLSGHWSIKLWW
jgi:hypothetical protein